MESTSSTLFVVAVVVVVVWLIFLTWPSCRGRLGPAGPAGPRGLPGPAGSVLGSAVFWSPPISDLFVDRGAAIPFTTDGPTFGSSGVTRILDVTGRLGFTVEKGTYQVSFSVAVTNTGKLALTLNGVELPHTQIGQTSPGREISLTTLITVTAAAGSEVKLIHSATSITTTGLTMPTASGLSSPGTESAVVTSIMFTKLA